MHLSQSGSRSDKRKARGRGLPPSSGVVLSNEARVRVRSFGFVQPCCSGTLWLSDAVCLRVHCATVPWEWLHKVLCASRVSIPRPSNLLSEHDPLCRRGSRVNFGQYWPACLGMHRVTPPILDVYKVSTRQTNCWQNPPTWPEHVVAVKTANVVFPSETLDREIGLV